MKRWSVEDVVAAESLILVTNPGLVGIFTTSLSENDVSPSTIANILLDLERWSEYVYAEFGISSKFHHLVLPDLRILLDVVFKMKIMPIKKRQRKKKLILCRQKHSRENLEKEGRWPLGGMKELICICEDEAIFVDAQITRIAENSSTISVGDANR